MWAHFYAADAEWIEYRHNAPPRAPHIMNGIGEIEPFLRGVCAQRLTLTIEDEIISGERAAYRVVVELEGGRRIIEHVVIYFARGRIIRQVDVEAWD